MVSYGHTLSTILGLRSNSGLRKALGTCSSHMIVVSIFYGTAIIRYFLPNPITVLNRTKWSLSSTPSLHPCSTPAPKVCKTKRWLELLGKSWEGNYHNGLISTDCSTWLNGSWLQRDITVTDSGKIKQRDITFLYTCCWPYHFILSLANWYWNNALLSVVSHMIFKIY